MPANASASFRTAYLQDLALVMAVNCVRNTVIENYHAAGKISDPEMKAFNVEVADRLYTVLSVLMEERFESIRGDFMGSLNYYYPYNWDKPKLAEDMLPDKNFSRKREKARKRGESRGLPL